jgi:hypothetical protein
VFCQGLFFLGDRNRHHLCEKIGQLRLILFEHRPQSRFLDAVDIVALHRSLQTGDRFADRENGRRVFVQLGQCCRKLLDSGPHSLGHAGLAISFTDGRLSHFSAPKRPITLQSSTSDTLHVITNLGFTTDHYFSVQRMTVHVTTRLQFTPDQINSRLGSKAAHSDPNHSTTRLHVSSDQSNSRLQPRALHPGHFGSRLQNKSPHVSPNLGSNPPQHNTVDVTSRLRTDSSHRTPQLGSTTVPLYALRSSPGLGFTALLGSSASRSSTERAMPPHGYAPTQVIANRLSAPVPVRTLETTSDLGSAPAHSRTMRAIPFLGFDPTHLSQLSAPLRTDTNQRTPRLGFTAYQPERPQVASHHPSAPAHSASRQTSSRLQAEPYFPPMVKVYRPHPVERSWPIPWIEPYSNSVCRITSVTTPSLSTLSWKDSAGLSR